MAKTHEDIKIFQPHTYKCKWTFASIAEAICLGRKRHFSFKMNGALGDHKCYKSASLLIEFNKTITGAA